MTLQSYPLCPDWQTYTSRTWAFEFLFLVLRAGGSIHYLDHGVWWRDRWSNQKTILNRSTSPTPRLWNAIYRQRPVQERNNNNNLLHLYSAFLDTQKALYIVRGLSPHPPPMCSIHLDDATAALVRQNAHHTPAYWWRGDRVMKPISVWGWLGDHDGQRPVG